MSYTTRRGVLKTLLFGGTALATPSALWAVEYGRGEGMPWVTMRGDPPYYGTTDARFFTPDERAAVAAISARLIPSDDDGPGATEADVVTFLDRQMAGFYGRGQHWYMKGPFAEGTDTQGYQSEYPPAELYRHALAELDAYCRAQDDESFAGLSEGRQDEILTGLDEEKITFDAVSAKVFFDLILKNTIEGYFADPIYGGNRDMVAWRYVGFPGTRYDYRDFVNHGGAPIQLEPVSLMGRPGWSRP
ncbi:gluconate 2-dehydrogenase subunit 3 family protein [Sulfitobacter dubius]|uniref:Gluconate 2-dehydrogenase subunit 3 n=1 Tax=Sulfitobacter dubius TaxID=218673 RepID=A0ABY3ZUG5_9RHOB|nr:gluconate 2-dehydrogenase subunit 3 family protein [Sulfitobacter dubius]UOA16463.1 Gluconate 2-dehydrogenase subunit 3 [Sulfitobacter dubius]